MPIKHSRAFSPRSPMIFLRRPAHNNIIQLTDQARIKAVSQVSQRSGLRAMSSITIAMAEGPAIRGTARGTINGSPAKLVLKTLSVPEKTIFMAIRNRIMPPDMLRAGGEISNKCMMYLPDIKKITNINNAIDISRSMILRWR